MNGIVVKNGYKVNNSGLRYEDVTDTADHLKARTHVRPAVGIICGSGLGGVAHMLKDTKIFDYKDIPGFAISTVPGHAGRLIFGVLAGKPVVCMQGRVHGYEGCPMWKITFPIRVMRELGIHTLLVTNASGGLNSTYKIGDLMIIKDHINLPGMAGNNPLVGLTDERLGPRFPAMSDAYNKDLRQLAWDVAHQLNLQDIFREGVYGVQFGPAFETVAECRMLKMIGSDVAGMSTAPEVLVAKHCGLKVFGMSLVTNNCVMEWDSKQVANHAEVLHTANSRAADMERFIYNLVEQIPDPAPSSPTEDLKKTHPEVNGSSRAEANGDIDIEANGLVQNGFDANSLGDTPDDAAESVAQ